MLRAGFEPTIPDSERPQTQALPRGHWGRLHKQVGIQHLHLYLYLYLAQASHCSKSACVAAKTLILLQCMLTHIIGHEIWHVGCEVDQGIDEV